MAVVDPTTRIGFKPLKKASMSRAFGTVEGVVTVINPNLAPIFVFAESCYHQPKPMGEGRGATVHWWGTGHKRCPAR